jgi:hypothetical protein
MEKKIAVECLSPAVAQGVLQDCLEDGNIVPTKHFRDELLNEGLTFADAMYVLRIGQIYDPGEPDIKTGEWKYTVEGHETDGKWIKIVFSFRSIDTAILITIFSIESRRRITNN